MSLPPTIPPLHPSRASLSWAPLVSFLKFIFSLFVVAVTFIRFLCELPTKERQNPFFRCLQASLPVQEYLFMPFDQAHKQYETARHLPPPLYVLFVQATAYGQACGEYGVGREEGLWEQRPRPGRHLEAPPAEESSRALLRSPQVTDAASPLHCPAWLLWPAGLRLD